MTAEHGVSPADAGRHPSLETLADLDEGLLEPLEAASVTAHLAGCADCRASHAELQTVPTRLAALEDVGPVPTDVGARLDATWADELARPLEGTAAATVTPLSSVSARRPRRDNRYLQAAAAAVLLLAAVGVGVSAVAHRNSAQTSSASDSAGSSVDGNAKSLSSTFSVLMSGTDYTAQTLPEAVPGLLLSTGSGVRDRTASPEVATPTDDPERLANGPELADCVTALAGGPATPLVVDIARYAGKPATVIVLATPDDPTHLDVWVVGPSCRQGADQVRLFQRVPRP